MGDAFLDEYDATVGAQRPWSVAWLKDLIEYNIPDIDEKEKREIIGIFKPLLDNAAKTNLTDKQILSMLNQYEIIWGKFFMYMKRGKKDPQLLVLKESLYAGYEQQLNRSKHFGQMRLVMEQHSIIKQISEGFNRTKNRLSFFKNKPENNDETNVMR